MVSPNQWLVLLLEKFSKIINCVACDHIFQIIHYILYIVLYNIVVYSTSIIVYIVLNSVCLSKNVKQGKVIMKGNE